MMSRMEFRSKDSIRTHVWLDVRDNRIVCINSFEDCERKPRRITRLDKQQAIQLRNFLNEFIEANNE